jgi:predicted transcriptional regulator
MRSEQRTRHTARWDTERFHNKRAKYKRQRKSRYKPFKRVGYLGRTALRFYFHVLRHKLSANISVVMNKGGYYAANSTAGQL